MAFLAAVGLLLLFNLPGEIARWYQAAAREAALDNDHDRALRHINRGLAWAQHPNVRLERAQLRREAGDLSGSLQDCNEVLRAEPQNADALMQRSLVYQRMGKHDQAIADLSQLVEMAEQANDGSPQRKFELATALKNRAYARALGKRELAAGLRDVEQALELTGQDYYVFLDTRGYLHYLLDNPEAALNDLEQAVAQAEENLQMLSTSAQSDPRVDRRPARQHRISAEEELAVLCHHRGLAYQALGREEPAQQDLLRARQLGYDPSKGVW